MSSDFSSVAYGFVGGMLVPVFQQFLVTPILKFRECVTETDHLLKFHYNLTTNSFSLEERRGNGCIKAMDEIRMASCRLEATYKAILGKRLFVRLGVIPELKSVVSASSELIRLSNIVGTNPMMGCVSDEKIRKLLGIARMNAD